jgi:3-hydroxyisobutyrate dehydrogenase-like beta-hydroxyacid dehydrogenase
MSEPRYGFIGVGDMGAAMVEHLLSTGADVTVYDLDEVAVQGAVELGAIAAPSAAELAGVVDVLSICVPAAHHIEVVLTGENGVADGAHPGLTILVHSTVSPETMRSAHATAAGWGVPLFDACVAGGVAAAIQGDLVMSVGGAEDLAPEARELIEIYGGMVFEPGPVGAGAALKIGFNVMTYAQFTALSAATDLVTAAGCDPAMLIESWRYAGQLGTLTERFAPMVSMPDSQITGDLAAGLATLAQIGVKDLDLAIELALDGGSVATGSLTAIRDDIVAVMRGDLDG